MKKTVLTLCIGITIGLLSGSLTGAFAAVADTVEARFANFSLIINKDDPIEIEPLTYKGSTFLPVREAANLLGYDLTYKADSRTIELNKSIDSLNAEFDKILGTEGDLVAESQTSGKSIEEQLTEINALIESNKHGIYISKIQLQDMIDMNMDPAVIQSSRDGIAKEEQRLAELEAKKAELEAQLTPTP